MSQIQNTGKMTLEPGGKMNNIKCPVCKTEMEQGKTELVMRRKKSVVVIEEVPALVCPQCEEASIDSEVSKKAYNIAEKELNWGVALEFCKYQAA